MSFIDLSRSTDPYAAPRDITVRLHDSVWRLLRNAADRVGVTEAAVIQQLIVRYADKLERE